MDARDILGFIEENLLYDKESGNFFWVNDRANGKIKSGSLAGAKTAKNYRQIRIHGRWYKCHRLVWLTETGVWPSDQIDHINGDGLDNRFENLREVNNYQNCTNRKRKSRSGSTGVYFDSKNKKWATGSYRDGVYRNLGRYSSKEEAEEVYHNFNKDRMYD